MRLPAGRRPVVFGGAFAALIFLAFMALRNETPAERDSEASNRSPEPPVAREDVPVVDVKIEQLEDRRAELTDAERNPFRFETRTAPTAPSRGGAAPARDVPVPPSAPAGPPPPPPISLRFIGLVEAPTQAGRVAIMSDGRGNVFYGKEGDIIEGRYKVIRIGADAAELSYLDGRGRQTIRLSGQ